MLRCRGGIMGGEWQGVGGGEARRGEGQGREEKKTVNSPFLSERTYHCVSCKYEGTRNATEYLAWRTGGVLVLEIILLPLDPAPSSSRVGRRARVSLRPPHTGHPELMNRTFRRFFNENGI